MKLIRKISVLAVFAIVAFPSAISAQGDSYGGYGGSMGGPGMSGPGMSGMMGGGLSEPSQLDLAKQRLMGAKNEQQRKQLVAVIRKELVGQYDKYLKQNQAQINQLQNRLDGLKKQLKTRVEAKDELVTLELTRIVNESKGLSWPAGQSDGGGYGGDMGMGGMMGGMSGGLGMGGMGGPRPGMGGMAMGGPGSGMGGGMDTGFGSDDKSTAASVEATSETSAGDEELFGGDLIADPNLVPEAISENNLRQIALACLNFESAYERFPSNLIDLDDKPLLSWRVSILPFVDAKDLYDKFRHDEPWNSEHNIALAAEMPDVFKSPGFDNKLKTLIQGFDAKGTVFESGMKVTFGQITDGSSNTILCVESAEDKAVIWTKPQDLQGDEDAEVEDLFRFNGVVTKQVDEATRMIVCKKSPIVRCDGATGWIRSDADEEDIEDVITMNDGQVINKNVFVSPSKDR